METEKFLSSSRFNSLLEKRKCPDLTGRSLFAMDQEGDPAIQNTVAKI